MAQREYGGMYPKERLENIWNNTENLESFTTFRDSITSNAREWAAKSDEELWSMVPGQELPRCIDVTWDYDFPDNPRLGCLGCGDDIYEFGAYPYEPDFENKPWKLTCPKCGIVFPTNDFGKYYQSGINKQGVFDPDVADKSLLFNTDHPDPNDPLHKYGVDDGYGFVKDGREYKYIGYYTWKYWRYIYQGLQRLSDAYLYSGDKEYARKAAILLDRIADVYPDMDWKPYGDMGWYHSDGSSRQGKIEGRIWETATMQQFARAYDKIISGTVDNPELYEFLAKKDQEFDLPGDKGTRDALITNIDTRLLETIAEALISKQIHGNQGMHQSSMACAALALNTEPKTSEWLDWIFAEDGGQIPTMMVQLFDRDGMADEAAPHYCFLWPGKLSEILAILEPYEAYTKNVISRDYPFIRNAYRAPWRVAALEKFTPNIGDTNAVGVLNLGVRPAMLATGFRYFNDDVAARYAWEANGYKAGALLEDVGSTTPAYHTKKLEEAALRYTEEPRLGENMAGYGLTTFEFSKGKQEKALWFYYGRNKGHGHQDRLNYSIYAYGTDLTPDLGYPEFANRTWLKRAAWNNNTISHNTVVVDKSIQTRNWTGFPHFFAVVPGFGVAEVESTNVYPQTTDYTRTIAFVETPDARDAYAVDFFRVAGGSDHLLSFHGPPGPVTATGLNLDRQTTGTYAGEDIAFGDNSDTHPYGYSYLKNVETDTSPAGAFSLDWKAEAGYRGVTADDDLHMRLHVVGESFTDVALADGVPPQNKPGNPKSIRYALIRRGAENGEALKSEFVSVAEPWKDKAFIEKVSRLDVGGPGAEGAIAVKVELAGGTTDYFISNPARKQVEIQDGHGLSTDGVYTWIREQDGRVTSASLTRGTFASLGDTRITGPGNISGKLVKFEKDIKQEAVAWVTFDEGNPKNLVGSQIIFDNDRQRNACYDIEKVEQDGDHWKITCGPGTFARGFVDTKDYSKGYVYNIKEGAAFYIPLTVTVKNPAPATAVASH